MRYHNITKEDMLNGDGLRTVLWLAGCSHACQGCQNPMTWDVKGGLPFDEAAKEELFEALAPSWISGVTFSGGEPFCQAEALVPVAEAVKAMHKHLMIYTGYLYEQLLKMEEPGVQRLLELADVLVDGPFLMAERNLTLQYRGSENQRVIDLAKTRAAGEIILYKSEYDEL